LHPTPAHRTRTARLAFEIGTIKINARKSFEKKFIAERNPLILLIVSQLPSIALIGAAHSW
jgi:hypothetical protein